jgi:hypothetical protein
MVSLQEEFSRLIYLYQEAAEGKQGNIEEVFRKSTEFVDHLKQTIRDGDAEDRKAALRMMKELLTQMDKQTKIICKKAGMTEEELVQRAANPANFVPEQWRSMQEARERLAKSGRELSGIIEESGVGKKESHRMDSAPEEPQESGEPPKIKGKKPKKSGWLRS